jgi:phosphotransferase system enzyme I (PtsI)
LGGDKLATQLSLVSDSTELRAEANPFLGLRAIRLCFRYPEQIFIPQLRGLFRASKEGKLKILLPMISGIDEFRKAKKIIEKVKEDLREEKIPFSEDVEIGVMIEVPSAALAVDSLAREADFLSIGTNDLIQYTLAVDRMNENVADLYDPLHPAILQLVSRIISVAHRYDKEVSMCGEMAAESLYAIVLLGLGLDEFSVPSAAILKIKRAIRNISYQRARQVVKELSQMQSRKEIVNHLKNVLRAGYEKYT